MELKELEYIVTIADEGGIGKAAQKLYLAQSSLSQYLSRYEAELGTKLFIRTGSGVRPTPAGNIFIHNAREMIRQFRRVQSELREAEQMKSGTISFGISSFRGSFLIPPVLEKFRSEYPTIDVIIHEHDSSVLKKKIAAGDLDLALIAIPSGHDSTPDTAIMQDEVCIVANRSHPVMEYAHYGTSLRPWLDIKDTAQFEYLLSNPDTVLGSIAEDLFTRNHIEPHALNRNLTAAFAKSMASQGLGLAFTYGSCAQPQTDVEYFSIGTERYFVNLALIFPPNGYRSRSNKAFEEMIRDFYHRNSIQPNLR